MNNKQPYHYPDNGTLPQFPSIIPGTFSPNDLYTNLWPQNSLDRTANKIIESCYTVPDQSTELGSKEFSSGSYGNIASTSTTNNPIESQYCRFANHQWNPSYSSCAQVGQLYNNETGTQPTYCNVPKGYTYYDNSYSYPQGLKTYPEAVNLNINNQSFYGSSLLSEKQNFNYDINLLPDFPPIDIQADEESDIVVEDSSSEGSEPDLQQVENKSKKCLICNNQYSLGVQFYILTAEKPLTMSTQVPVKKKISEFVGKHIFSVQDYLCNDCLGLINSIDHLQFKVDNLVKSLVGRVNTQNPIIPTFRKKYPKFRCKKCFKVLCIKAIMHKHVQRHKVRVFLCELCGKKLPTIKKLNSHLKQHNLQTNKALIPAFKCQNSSCGKLFRTKFHLKEHQNYCLGLLPFKCKNPHCNKKFASSTKLKNHTKLKHDKKFVAICSICNIGFVKLSEYKSHKVTHSTDKKFACTKCDKSYKTLSNLNFHLKSHEKALPYVCHVCRKGFMRKEYHEAHMNHHKGLKNFSCTVCERKFVSQKNLDAHAKYHEGTVKSHTCNTCKKVVTSCFEEHLRVHLNLKEFECDSCDMKFNTKNSLSKHKKKKHVRISEIT